jgi:hypothetical protein
MFFGILFSFLTGILLFNIKKKGLAIMYINPLSFFFKIELLVILYSIPCIIGMLLIQYLLNRFILTSKILLNYFINKILKDKNDENILDLDNNNKNRKKYNLFNINKYDKERFISLLIVISTIQLVSLITSIRSAYFISILLFFTFINIFLFTIFDYLLFFIKKKLLIQNYIK